MLVVALVMPTGQPLSWLAMTVVVLGLLGLGAGTIARLRQRATPSGHEGDQRGSSGSSSSSTGASPRP